MRKRRLSTVLLTPARLSGCATRIPDEAQEAKLQAIADSGWVNPAAIRPTTSRVYTPRYGSQRHESRRLDSGDDSDFRVGSARQYA